MTGEERIVGAVISFKLDSPLESDTGKEAYDHFFGREAQVTVSGGFGALSFGRMGSFSPTIGTCDVVYWVGDAFDGGDWDVFGLASSSVLDNAVTCQSPEILGFRLTMQYSFQMDSVNGGGSEGHSTTDRYFSAALNYEAGGLEAVLSYENLDRGSADSGEAATRDGRLFTLGANYDFAGAAKVFLMGQLFRGWDEVGNASFSDWSGEAADSGFTFRSGGFNGWGAHVGAIFPVAGGDLLVGLCCVDAELDGGKYDSADYDADIEYYGAAVRCVHPFSKRTSVCAGASYGVNKADNCKIGGTSCECEMKTTSVCCGVPHTFQDPLPFPPAPGFRGASSSPPPCGGLRPAALPAAVVQ